VAKDRGEGAGRNDEQILLNKGCQEEVLVGGIGGEDSGKKKKDKEVLGNRDLDQGKRRKGKLSQDFVSRKKDEFHQKHWCLRHNMSRVSRKWRSQKQKRRLRDSECLKSGKKLGEGRDGQRKRVHSKNCLLDAFKGKGGKRRST